MSAVRNAGKLAAQDRLPPPDYFSRTGLLAETAIYVLRHPLQLLGAVVVPVCLGAIALYIALDAYLLQLLEILRAPSESAAALLLGIVSAAFVVGLFAHSVASAGIAATMCAGKPLHAIRIAITQSDLRLFAASLRLLLVTCLIGGLIAAFGMLLSFLGIQAEAGRVLLRLLLLAITLVLLVRLGMLLPPVAVREKGSILRRSFVMTRGRTLGVVLFAFILLLPGILLEITGDYVIRHVVGFSLEPYNPTLAQSSVMLRAILPYFIVVMTISYAISLACLTVGSSLLYRRLNGAGR